MSMWDATSAAAYGVVPIGSAYPTHSPIGQVGAMGRPGPALLSGDHPMTAFLVVLGLTFAGFFAASYTGAIRLGPLKLGGSASAGRK